MATATDRVAPTTGRRPRLPVRRVLLGLAGLWLVACAFFLVLGMLDLIEGRRAARRAADLEPLALARGAGAPDLEEARDRFGAGADRLGHPLLAPWRLLPGAGPQFKALARTARGAETVAATAASTAPELQRALDDARADPGRRADALQRAAAALEEAADRLDTVRPASDAGLVGPVSDVRDEFATVLADARTATSDGAAVAAALATLLEGPRRYLLLATNNAEMRGGSGMPLQAGTIDFAGGRITVSTLEPIHTIPVPAGVVIADESLARHWGWLEPQQEWRNLLASPRFDASAALAARMWEAAGRGAVDGVIALDPIVLQAALRAADPGALDLPNGAVEVDTIIDELLHVQYTRFPEFTDKPERRERLAEIASAAFGVIDGGRADPLALVDELVPVATGRHLMAWSAQPAEQQAWTTLSIDGTLSERSLLVSSLNRGGNKLDYFLPLEAELQLEPAQETTVATLRVRARNDAPPDGPADVIGPHPGLDLVAGEYRGILAVNLPAGARDVTINGSKELAAAGADGPTQLAAVAFDVERGETAEHVIRFVLPGRRGRIDVEPGARWPTTKWRAKGEMWVDTSPKSVAW